MLLSRLLSISLFAMKSLFRLEKSKFLQPLLNGYRSLRMLFSSSESNINSYSFLRNQLKEDLSHSVDKTLVLSEMKKKLGLLYNTFCKLNLVKTNQPMGEIFSRLLNSDTEAAFHFYLRELYCDAFFSKKDYLDQVDYFKTANPEAVIKRRLHSLNRPQTLAYRVLLKEDDRCFPQVERASLITKAALDLHLSFNEKKFDLPLNVSKNFNVSSYEHFFCAAIIPQDNRHILYVDRTSCHIVVM